MKIKTTCTICNATRTGGGALCTADCPADDRWTTRKKAEVLADLAERNGQPPWSGNECGPPPKWSEYDITTDFC